MKRFFSVAVAASVFCAAAITGSAQAVVVDFENADMTNVPFGSLITDGDYVTQSGYYFQGLDPYNFGGAPDFALVGAMINGADSDTCVDNQCPAGNATNYLASLNGSIVGFGKLNGGASVLTSFDAAFLAFADAAPTRMPAYLAIEADRDDGSYAVGVFALGAIGRGATTAFQTYYAADAQYIGGTGTLTSGNVTNLYAYAYYCGTDSSCQPFQSNEGQFALDNVAFEDAAASPTPEAATWAMMLAGFGGIGAAMRRRKSGIAHAA